MVFVITGDKPISLAQIPTKIELKEEVRPQLSHYTSPSGETMSIDLFKSTQLHLLSFKTNDDDEDEYMWETREDKIKYENFLANWKPVYDDPRESWKEVEFQVVKQEEVPDQYKDFITSTIIIDTSGNNDFKKSLCRYYSNPAKMMRVVAEELGFQITTIDKAEATRGKTVFIYESRPLEFSRCNEEFVKFDENTRRSFGNKEGSLEQCIKKYELEYSTIYNKLLSIANVIDNKAVTGIERAELLKILDTAMIIYRSVDPYKSTRTNYRDLGSKLTELRNKLTLISGQ